MGFVEMVDAVEGVAGMPAVDFGSEWHLAAAQLPENQSDTHNSWKITSIPKAARIDVMLGCWSAMMLALRQSGRRSADNGSFFLAGALQTCLVVLSDD